MFSPENGNLRGDLRMQAGDRRGKRRVRLLRHRMKFAPKTTDLSLKPVISRL